MTMSQYWLAQWLDENEVRNDWEIDHLIHSKGARQGLVNTIQRAADDIAEGRYKYPEHSELGESIVAGRRLDLSGSLTCPWFDCLREGVDSTFKRVWHYFDRIVVEGLAPGPLMEQVKKSDEKGVNLLFVNIREQARLLLYLRQIGADPYAVFTRKSFAFCQEHWREHAKALGLQDAVDNSKHEKVINKLLGSSEFNTSQAGDGLWVVDLTNTIFPEPPYLLFSSADPPTPHDVVCGLMSSYATAMISDVGLARRLTLPLIEPTNVPWRLPRSSKRAQSSEQQVALALRLPVFDHLSTRDFIKIREDHQPEFETFRAALRAEIQKRLISEGNPGSPAEIARRIEKEYLRPELAKIEQKVSGSRKALVKKTAVDLTVGTVASAVGTIASVPLMITSGVMAVGGAVRLMPVINQYIDDRASIRTSDLYFLWRVEKKAGHK